MGRLPPSRRGLAALALALATTACGGDEARPPETDAGEPDAIPFAGDGVLATGAFFLVSGEGDTLRFLTVRDGSRLLLSRTRRTPFGLDSVAALVDAGTKAPLASYQRRHDEGDTLVARVSYGTGFEGQARLTLVGPEGRASGNLRTPVPVLDAAQIPQVLGALDVSVSDTVSFNYVAPFERRALAARILIGRLDTLRVGAREVPAHEVILRVRGLEERAWFAATPGERRLLRYEEPTRGTTWVRPSFR